MKTQKSHPPQRVCQNSNSWCFVRASSCDFVLRPLYVAKKNEPRNHTNQHETEHALIRRQLRVLTRSRLANGSSTQREQAKKFRVKGPLRLSGGSIGYRDCPLYLMIVSNQGRLVINRASPCSLPRETTRLLASGDHAKLKMRSGNSSSFCDSPPANGWRNRLEELNVPAE